MFALRELVAVREPVVVKLPAKVPVVLARDALALANAAVVLVATPLAKLNPALATT